MKKITLLLAICFAFQFNMYSQCPGGAPAPGYTCIPDNNLEAALVALGIDTVANDNQILNSEAAGRTSFVNLTGEGINDFTGIEAFINLTALKVSNNPATSIDITNNVALVDFDMSSSEFASIDLSGNASLTMLNTSYSDNLTSLDVTANVLITDIDTEECNVLSTLDITGITTLVNLELLDNDISTLNVSGNPNLETLNVRQNNLTVLDLSSNAVLTSLNARQNALTDLDMRNGNNANVTFFNSDFNGGLTCVFVDDATAGYLASLPWSKDANSTFVSTEAECNTLTVEDDIRNVFNMFPNPAKNTLFVNANAQNSQLTIYDITGKLVLNKALDLGQNTIDVSQMASGVYLARFATDGNVQTEKLIVQ